MEHLMESQRNAEQPGPKLPDPEDVERDYGIKRSTQAVWRSTNRYGWRDIAVKVGRSIRYRREDLEKWLASRTGLPTSRNTESKGGVE
jgi:hypothetical protein